MQLFLLLLALQEPAAPQGPAAYFKFDELNTGGTAANSAGGPTGTYVGPPTVSSTVNQPPITYPNLRSLNFNGTSQAVTVGDFGAFTNTTVAVWVNRSGTTATRQSIVSYKEGNGVNCGFVLCLNEAGNTNYPRMWVQVNGGWVNAEAATAVAQGAWTHLAGSYDGSNIRLYVNGTQTAITAAAGAMTNGTQNCVIGARADAAQHWYPGLVDDVRIYSRALTAVEVAVLAAGCPTPQALMATPAIGSITLNWAAPGGPAATYTYNVKRQANLTMPPNYVTIATTNALSYTDTAVSPGLSYDYVVTALSAAESGPTAPVTSTPVIPPPRTQVLGNGESRCGCGTTSLPGWSSLVALALALALLLRR